MIRRERPEDIAAIRVVNEAAFGQSAEAELVDALRQQADPFISLVAERDDEIVGHICFSPVTVGDASDGLFLGLGPMAVWPGAQNSGIGSRLVEAGLEECRRRGARLVVVLGHPRYYPRFGFRPATQLGLSTEYDVPEDVFMAQVLAGETPTGLVRYHPAFGALGSGH